MYLASHDVALYFIFNRSSLRYEQLASYVNVCNVASTVITVQVFSNFFYTWANPVPPPWIRNGLLKYGEI